MAHRISSVKKNGVEFAIQLKGIANKECTDIEVAWTITYTGPRSPLTIVKPSFDLPTGQTMVFIHAAPKGKDYVFAFVVLSPSELIMGGKRFLTDPYGGEMKEAPFPPQPGPFPAHLAPLIFRTKDWFLTVPKGKSAKGILTVSGQKLKEFVVKSYPGELAAKHPTRFFVEVRHQPWDRGESFPGDRREGFNLDAWIGALNIPVNLVPGVTQW